MTANRELLEFAAKAAGIDIEWVQDDHSYSDFYLGDLPSIRNLNKRDKAHWETWAPLTDDGQALRLACKLGLRVDTNYRTGADARPGVGVWISDDNSPYPPFWTANARDICAATRQTIVRAAAEIGKAMP